MRVQVFLNGQFVPEDRAVVSVFDRGFLYGDGLFETMHVVNGRPFRWTEHLERLQYGAGFLKLKLTYKPAELLDFARQLVAQNQLPEALLRLTVSRGVGPRGYSPKGAMQPTCAMTLHPVPAVPAAELLRWRLVTSTLRLPVGDPLAAFKTANKLWQVIARAEADAAGADEALLLNTAGHVAEATSANIFWVERGAICTPPLTAGILPGVTRATVLKLARAMALPVAETDIIPARLAQTDGVFLTSSAWGLVPVESLDGVALKISPLVARLRVSYAELIRV